MSKALLIAKYKNFLHQYQLTPSEAVISAGAACVMYDIRDHFEDLDVDMPTAIFDIFASVGYRARTIEGIDGMTHVIELRDRIDIHRTDVMKDHIEIKGVAVYTLEALLHQKQQLNRPKDQADIRALEILLDNQLRKTK